MNALVNILSKIASIFFLMMVMVFFSFLIYNAQYVGRGVEKDQILMQYMQEYNMIQDLFEGISSSNKFQETDPATLKKILQYSKKFDLRVYRNGVIQSELEIEKVIAELESNLPTVETKIKPLLNSVEEIIGVDYSYRR